MTTFRIDDVVGNKIEANSGRETAVVLKAKDGSLIVLEMDAELMMLAAHRMAGLAKQSRDIRKKRGEQVPSNYVELTDFSIGFPPDAPGKLTLKMVDADNVQSSYLLDVEIADALAAGLSMQLKRRPDQQLS